MNVGQKSTCPHHNEMWMRNHTARPAIAFCWKESARQKNRARCLTEARRCCHFSKHTPSCCALSVVSIYFQQKPITNNNYVPKRTRKNGRRPCCERGSYCVPQASVIRENVYLIAGKRVPVSRFGWAAVHLAGILRNTMCYVGCVSGS